LRHQFEPVRHLVLALGFYRVYFLRVKGFEEDAARKRSARCRSTIEIAATRLSCAQLKDASSQSIPVNGSSGVSVEELASGGIEINFGDGAKSILYRFDVYSELAAWRCPHHLRTPSAAVIRYRLHRL